MPTWTVRSLAVLALVPIAFGVVAPFYRDAIVTHFPAKVETARLLLDGEVPFVFRAASCGQILLGNPNFGTFFPTTLAYLVLPPATAFGLHFALVWLLGAVGARRWARAEGVGRVASEWTGLAFALSGPFLSAWTFHNAGAALAIGPWLGAAAAKIARRHGRARWRAVPELAFWGALEIVAGEPVVALVTFLVVGLHAAARRGFWSRATALAGGLILAAGLAAPQLATAWQAMHSSSRELARYSFAAATEASMSPARMIETLVSFPFGRPDLVGPGGFDGHAFFGGHAPYLWSLHVGVLVVVILVAGASGATRLREWLFVAVALVLSFGQHLPGAESFYPVFSLGGRIRYPIKAWYLIVLVLVPILARGCERLLHRSRPLPFVERIAVVVVLAVAVIASAAMGVSTWSWAGLALGAIATYVLAFVGPTGRRLALSLGLAGLAVAHVPLVRLVLARPPVFGHAELAGRVFERVHVQPHARDDEGPPRPAREPFDRAATELWALTGAARGLEYAFDRDPDGTYSYYDRITREAVDQMSWADRAMELRIAGVRWVVTDEALPAPYATRERLSGNVRLHELDEPAPVVRFATLVHRSPHFNGAFTIHRRPDYDPRRETVLPGEGETVGEKSDVTPRVVEATSSRLRVEVESARAGVLVWGRTYHPAYRATVDGRSARVLVADAHLIGVEVPEGRHEVVVAWDSRPLLVGALACAVAAILSLGILWSGRDV